MIKTKRFSNARIVGDPVKTAKVYSDQDADEILLLNVSNARETAESFLDSVREIARATLAPLAVGGGIRTISDVEDAFRAGADKVVINTLNYTSPRLVTQIVNIFGRQAVVAGIDFANDGLDTRLISRNGSVVESTGLRNHLLDLEGIGAGEIFLQSLDRDGSGSGYDLQTLQFTLRSTRVPIICAGGAGNYGHLLDAFQVGADAVACGTLFNFGDNNPWRAKAYLRNHGIPLKRSL